MTAAPPQPFSAHDRVEILLREYVALYGLATFRMTSLDRRAPVEAATLVAFLAAVAVLPPAVQMLFLLTVPVALLWFLRTTINHARSFADILARLAEIERHVNDLAGEELLAFQSRHPSRYAAVGGRTGRETVGAVYCTCLILLAACAILAAAWSGHFAGTLWVYWAFLGSEAAYLTQCVLRLRRYAYRKAPPAT